MHTLYVWAGPVWFIVDPFFHVMSVQSIETHHNNLFLLSVITHDDLRWPAVFEVCWGQWYQWWQLNNMRLWAKSLQACLFLTNSAHSESLTADIQHRQWLMTKQQQTGRCREFNVSDVVIANDGGHFDVWGNAAAPAWVKCVSSFSVWAN